MDSAVEAEAVVRPRGKRHETLRRECAPAEHDRYARAERVRRLLWRWEQASRNATALVGLLSRRLPASNRVNRQPDMFTNAVILVVDVDRLLLDLPQRERRVVLEIAVDGRRESWVAHQLGLNQGMVSRLYWAAVLQLDEWLREAGYFGAA